MSTVGTQPSTSASSDSVATKTPATTATTTPQEFIVRAPNAPGRQFSLLRFHSANAVDFTKSRDVHMHRENNLRQYKTAYDIVDMPAFGAGSEFGREQKAEARRKKYGYSRREYRTGDQPWVMTVGKGREARRFKGTREGGISDNVTYFVFYQCKDGAFEAHPVSEWYNMNPEINYRYLKEDEAEEEYTRRHKTMNLFNVMVKRRINEDATLGSGEPGMEGGSPANGKPREADDADDEGGDGADGPGGAGRGKKYSKTGRKPGRKRSSLKLTDMDDWVASSDDEGDAESGSDGADKGSDAGGSKEGGKKKGGKQKKKKKKKQRGDVDSEAMEDSDLDDHDGDEVDYMTHSSSDEEKLSEGEREDKYKTSGVDEETALKALLTDLSSSEDENDNKSDKDKIEEPLDEDEESRGPNSKSRGGGNNSSSSDAGSSSSSAEDSDSEIDKKASDKVAYFRRLSTGVDASPATDQSATTTLAANRKRPSAGQEDATAGAPPRKKSVSSVSSLPPLPSSGGSNSAISITEARVEALVRKYLLRKPITAHELLKKIRTKNLLGNRSDAATLLASILERINPSRHKVNNIHKLYLKG